MLLGGEAQNVVVVHSDLHFTSFYQLEAIPFNPLSRPHDEVAILLQGGR